MRRLTSRLCAGARCRRRTLQLQPRLRSLDWQFASTVLGVMSLYFFHLRDGDRRYIDHIGVELPDNEAAVQHAQRVAAELVKNREKVARLSRIKVQDTTH